MMECSVGPKSQFGVFCTFICARVGLGLRVRTYVPNPVLCRNREVALLHVNWYYNLPDRIDYFVSGFSIMRILCPPTKPMPTCPCSDFLRLRAVIITSSYAAITRDLFSPLDRLFYASMMSTLVIRNVDRSALFIIRGLIIN